MSVRTNELAPCGVRHVVMAQPFAPIEPAPGERGLYVLFWREGRPVGFRILTAGELPVPAAAVPMLAADSAAQTAASVGEAETRSTHPSLPPPTSVVICTRDRPNELARCLASLVRCEPAPAEIIVVDNAPRDEASASVAETYPRVRYLREPQPGLSHARNTGVREARGEIVAFTDDDVEVPVDWVARLTAPFADPKVGCVTGLVIPADLAGEAACLFEFEIGGFGRQLARRRFDAHYLRRGWWRSPDVWKIGAGANMAVRRVAFADVGLFDPRLGAGASGCSEDSEFWFRLLRADQICYYEPAAVVFHHHRPDWRALAQQLRAYARGHVVALFIQFSQDRRPCHLVRAFAIMPWYYMKLTLRAVRQRDRHRLALVGPQLRGCLEGPFHAVRWLLRDGPSRLETAGSKALRETG